MQLKTCKMTKKWVQKLNVIYFFPEKSKLKKAQWNCKSNSGHIHKIKIGSKSPQLYLSNPCKNIQKDEEMAAEIMYFPFPSPASKLKKAK